MNFELSCEFFPPNTDEGAEKLCEVRQALRALRPAFFSVTYGAGGSTRNRTFEAVIKMQEEGGCDAAPHLTCVASTRDGVRAILELYRGHGIHRIVALRGDMPSGMLDPGEFSHANELVAFIRAETGSHFHIEVAAYPEYHPQATNPAKDLEHFRRKVEAGADGAITQYFYNADAYFRFLDDCARIGIGVPVVPGIMPITNFVQLARFSDACGAEIPRWVRRRLESFGDDRDAIRAFGLDVVTALCERLLAGGAPGLHFYTMNQSAAVLAICDRLGLVH
ncbi:5,10-methylenetetrahydrofolate reductase (NAD(P)) [Plasticicumulans lactativorans]|uniref:Methylenetetrahydrofolate reductase n=1 Tax=Plasticicumulans lactativorans TaxID=1133106 RepID=A0A4R2L643_9GAMM|nr:methylenetetrahydrofolate reductase [NAD(P)H] [Plasticicumulans lactativorans]TCO80747.1 5,10-methylenetetrahydrofolate reductase (NAD(P)) [Plasticicumulans lactativorans]